MNKLIMKTCSDDTRIMPVHLYEVQNKKDMYGILSIIKNVDNYTCVIISESPQIITTKYPQLIHTIKTLIRFVVVEKMHLFNSSGRSFRYELSVLQSKLFSKSRKHSPMIFFAANSMQNIQVFPRR